MAFAGCRRYSLSKMTTDTDEIQATYAPLLRQCSRSKTLAEGQRLHAIIRRTGHDRHTFLANLLIQMYGNCGNLQEAKTVFEAMYQPNGFSWNIMLGAYVQNGRLQEARNLFDRMPEDNVVSWNAMVAAYARLGQLHEARRMFDKMALRDVVSWNTIVVAYAQNGYLEDARSLFDGMPCRNVVSCNSMITAYAQNGHLEEARDMFDGMSDRDVVSWTAMVSAYAQDGHGKEALDLFQLMDLEGAHPNKITFTSVVDACASIAALLAGGIIHADIISYGLQTDATVGNALVNMYAKCGDVDNAKKLFEEMPQRDVVSWTALTAGYAQTGHLPEARSMFERMPQRDVVSWTSTIAGFSQNGNLEEADSMFALMPQRNVVTWNTMITAYAENGQGKRSVKLFQLMDLEGMRPDRITFSIVVVACASMTALAEGKLVHATMLESGFSPDAELITCLIHMYGKCGSLDIARKLFDQMPHLDIVPWNVMISVYARCGHCSLAIELFQLMVQEGIHPNVITSVGVISACSHAGTLKDGWHYFVSFKGDYGINSVIDHYVCMIDLLGRAGLLKEAEELIQSMPFEADGMVWLALLGACKTHGDVDRAACAAERVMKLDSDNSAPYVLLSNVYSS